VVYDAQGGANAAARAWWMLRAVGHQAVSVLDGGWQAAVAAGVPVDADQPSVREVAAYPASSWRLPTADIERVDAARLDTRCRVVDVRSARRYRGEIEPFDPIAGQNRVHAGIPEDGRVGDGGEVTQEEDALGLRNVGAGGSLRRADGDEPPGSLGADSLKRIVAGDDDR
jgi:thiosulfate/3-mercaptopyruvate sulfurtransferase